MGNTELICSEDTMDSLAEKFGLCQTQVNQIISGVQTMEQDLQSAYTGMAEACVEECFGILVKHLEVLSKCYFQLQEVVTVTKEMYVQVDEKSAEQMRVGC